MEERIENVEVKVAYLEKYVMELDGVVRELADRLGELRRELADLKNAQPPTAPAAEGDDALEYEVPPHY